MDSYKRLEESGVYIHYSPEHYKDGSNVNFSIEFLDRETLNRVATGWYNDNHEFGDASETMSASVKLARWYLEDPKRISLINSGYNDPEYIAYTSELSKFTKELISNTKPQIKGSVHFDNDTMEKYVAFICGELADEYSVTLNEPKGVDGAPARIKKAGPRIHSKVYISVIESYTRSAKLTLVFDRYEKEDIFYMSRHKSPDVLLHEIYNKIDKIVNKAFIEDGREDEIRELYRVKHEIYNAAIKEALDKLKIQSNGKEDKSS
jgi:hypothetical protein